MTDAGPRTRPRLAGALVVLVAASAYLALAATGHDRAVTVLALATLLVAVLDATASALADR